MTDIPDAAPTEVSPQFQTAFAIAISHEGDVIVERDPAALNFKVLRAASLIEVRRYIAEILSDLQAQAAAEYVTLRLAALTQQAAQETE
jgi:hypothetical protein